MSQQSLVGTTGLVTTSIPVAGMGEVRVLVAGGTTTFGAYCADRETTVRAGTRVTVIELYPPRTLVVQPDL